ncbi:hypothetical protein AAC387_Pa03g2940 [Persea americana]
MKGTESTPAYLAAPSSWREKERREDEEKVVIVGVCLFYQDFNFDPQEIGLASSCERHEVQAWKLRKCNMLLFQ